MALVYAGIDEAGFGPMLGPLCVGLAVLRVEGWAPGEPAPDLWVALESAVARGVKGAGVRLPVADSKVLKLPNSGKRHPLTHLERGCLSFLAAGGVPTLDDDADLFDVLGAQLAVEPWYAGDATRVPVACDADRLGIDGNLLAACLRDAGVSIAHLGCVAVAEPRFNEIVRDAGKGATTLGAIAEHVRTARRCVNDGDEIRIVCDRLGGRTRYSRVLETLCPGGVVTPITETDRGACYDVVDAVGAVRVIFQVEAEQAHMPVALASMLAKYVREMAMGRFNRYWSGRVEGLKPTAGYVADARRWLSDAGDAVTPEERRAMVRLA